MPTISPSRIGIDIGRKMPLEDAIVWAAANEVGIIDIQLDTGANVVTGFDQTRTHAIRRSCDHHEIRLGLHTLSAVNVAEYAPLVSDAVDAYLKALHRHRRPTGCRVDCRPCRISFLCRHSAAHAGWP